MIWLPAVEHVVRFHAKIVERTGGSHGIRDLGLIESALMRASAGFGDYEEYPSVEEKAAAVCCGLVFNHGFIDGNKRIGVEVMRLILVKNGVKIRYTQRELIDLGLALAQGKYHESDVIRWIREHLE